MNLAKRSDRTPYRRKTLWVRRTHVSGSNDTRQSRLSTPTAAEPTGEIPDQIGNERGNHGATHGNRETEPACPRQTAGRKQDRHRRERDPELVGENV